LAYYELDPARIAALEATLRFLASKAGPPGFAIRAAWLDGAFEDATTAAVRTARLADLLTDVRAARIGNNVRYEISEAAAHPADGPEGRGVPLGRHPPVAPVRVRRFVRARA
jgi:hypothetical protein